MRGAGGGVPGSQKLRFGGWYRASPARSRSSACSASDRLVVDPNRAASVENPLNDSPVPAVH